MENRKDKYTGIACHIFLICIFSFGFQASAEIESPRKIVVQHVSEPKFRLTIVLAPSAVGTVVSWSQAFESADVASRVEHIVVPANEQNLDRLSAEVLRKPG